MFVFSGQCEIHHYVYDLNKALVVICPLYSVHSMDSQGNVIIISDQIHQALNVALPTVIFQSAQSKANPSKCFFYSLFKNNFSIDFSMELYHAPKVTHSVAISNAE